MSKIRMQCFQGFCHLTRIKVRIKYQNNGKAVKSKDFTAEY